MASSRRGSPTHHTEVTGCGAATVGSGAVATTTQPNAPATKAPPTTVPVAVAFGDGTLIVGVGIPPGRYVASNVAGCFWGVGDLSNVTADHLVEVGQAVIDISSSDAAFQSHGCGGWVRSVLAARSPRSSRQAVG